MGKRSRDLRDVFLYQAGPANLECGETKRAHVYIEDIERLSFSPVGAICARIIMTMRAPIAIGWRPLWWMRNAIELAHLYICAHFSARIYISELLNIYTECAASDFVVYIFSRPDIITRECTDFSPMRARCAALSVNLAEDMRFVKVHRRARSCTYTHALSLPLFPIISRWKPKNAAQPIPDIS